MSGLARERNDDARRGRHRRLVRDSDDKPVASFSRPHKPRDERESVAVRTVVDPSGKLWCACGGRLELLVTRAAGRRVAGAASAGTTETDPARARARCSRPLTDAKEREPLQYAR